jgi:hypothetical protein
MGLRLRARETKATTKVRQKQDLRLRQRMTNKIQRREADSSAALRNDKQKKGQLQVQIPFGDDNRKSKSNS